MASKLSNHSIIGMHKMEKKNIVEKIDTVIVDDQTLGLSDFDDKVSSITSQLGHKYDSFELSLVKEKSHVAVVVSGSRQETDQEYTDRSKEEKLLEKRTNDAELKEYLRLKKKYGKNK